MLQFKRLFLTNQSALFLLCIVTAMLKFVYGICPWSSSYGGRLTIETLNHGARYKSNTFKRLKLTDNGKMVARFR